MSSILEDAFVLHAKPFRDTSLLVDFFTLKHGRIAAIARSARGLQSRFKGILQPFSPLLISWSGKTELMQLTHAEGSGLAYVLPGKILFSGLYLNELLIRLLPRFDPYPELFQNYQRTLQILQASPEKQQHTLRIFEKELIQQLGYGLEFNKEAITGKAISENGWYYLDIERGLIPCMNQMRNPVFLGSHLLAIKENNFENSEILKSARKLMRLILKSLLGNYKLRSRELFHT